MQASPRDQLGFGGNPRERVCRLHEGVSWVFGANPHTTWHASSTKRSIEFLVQPVLESMRASPRAQLGLVQTCAREHGSFTKRVRWAFGANLC